VAKITTVIEDDLLTLTISGNISAIELIGVVDAYYISGDINDVIWDLTDGSLQSIPIDEFEKIANAAKLATLVGTRKGGKTAFIGNTATEYTMIRFYTVIAELSGVPIEYKVFRTLEDAKCWIGKNTLEAHQL
jgi:hypothetical protein